MEKNYLDGVVPPAKKRSIRDIPVPPRNRKHRDNIKKTPEESIPPTPPEDFTSNLDNDVPIKTNSGGSSKKKRNIIIGIVILVLVGLFIILSSFDSATLTLQAKRVDSSVTKNLQIGDLSSTESSYDIGYRTIELAKQVELEVEADSEEFVQQNASGVITIFNEYSTKQQNLIKNTRFESPSGLIYKIQESISVPGYTEVNGEIVPGQLDAEVVAAEAGDEYNTDSTEFTIPGFEGQEPFDFFYAETKTPISGGFDGVRKIVSEEDINTASTQLREDVTNALVDDLQQQITDEFIAVYNADSFTYFNIEQEDAANGENVILKLKGEVTAKVFNKVDLSNAVALDTINEYTMDQDVLIQNIEDTSLFISNEVLVEEVEDEEGEIEEVETSIESLNVSGNMEFIWQNDIEEIKARLVNVKKSDLGSVMQNYAGVSKAEATIKPFWRSKFPSNIKDIKVVFKEI